MRHIGMAAWGRGGFQQTFMRATKVQFRTTFSAGLLPPLRQTARWKQPISVGLFVSLVMLINSNSTDTTQSFRDCFNFTCLFLTASLRSVALTFQRYKITYNFSIFITYCQKKSHCFFGLYNLVKTAEFSQHCRVVLPCRNVLSHPSRTALFGQNAFDFTAFSGCNNLSKCLLIHF